MDRQQIQKVRQSDSYHGEWCSVAETWRRVWGDGNFFSRTKISEWRYFFEKIPFSQQEFLMTFFLVTDLVFRIFPFFYQIFRIFTMLNVVYDPFLTRKPPFFTLFILSRTSDNTTSQNIGGGRMHGPSPHLKLLGDRLPSPPRFPPLQAPADKRVAGKQYFLLFQYVLRPLSLGDT